MPKLHLVFRAAKNKKFKFLFSYSFHPDTLYYTVYIFIYIYIFYCIYTVYAAGHTDDMGLLLCYLCSSEAVRSHHPVMVFITLWRTLVLGRDIISTLCGRRTTQVSVAGYFSWGSSRNVTSLTAFFTVLLMDQERSSAISGTRKHESFYLKYFSLDLYYLFN